MREKYNIETDNDTEVCEQWNELQSEFKRINEAFENGKNEVINRPEAFGLQKEQKPSERNEEDERIRKEIVSIIEQYGRICEKEGDPCLELHDCLAWLEKQKEQEPAALRDSRQIALMIENGRRSGVIEGRKQVVNNPEEYGLCKPAEWSENFDEEVEKIHKRYPEVSFAKLTRIAYHFSKWANRRKDIEWSGEDDAAHTRILGAVAKAFMGVLPTKPSEEDVHWLKSLPERFNLQPKMEWGEGEMKVLDSIIDDYKKANRSFCGYAGKIVLLNAIRDGKYNLPKQEWSEEDILNLDNIIWLCDNCEKGIETTWIPSQARKIKYLMKSIKEGSAQKPAEWSDDDKARLKVIKEELEKYIMFKQYGTPLSVDDISWLESLPERFNPLPKQGWSEEDENMLNKCISRMTDIIPVTGNSGGIKDMTFETRTEMECVKWLKKKFNR